MSKGPLDSGVVLSPMAQNRPKIAGIRGAGRSDSPKTALLRASAALHGTIGPPTMDRRKHVGARIPASLDTGRFAQAVEGPAKVQLADRGALGHGAQVSAGVRHQIGRAHV